MRKRQKLTLLYCIPLIMAAILWILVAINNYIKAKNASDAAIDQINQTVSSIMQSVATPAPQGSNTVIVTVGENNVIDPLIPALDELFDEMEYTANVENNKIVTRVTASDAAEIAAEIENGGDYAKWLELLEAYTSYNEQIAQAAAEQELDFPALLYGMDDAENILFTIIGSTVAYSAVEEPPKNADAPVVEMREPTLGEKNALETAKRYLEFTSFSYEGLIDQLKYEKYTAAEATYAAINCGADWYDQAYKTAQRYLEFTSFSREGLIDQLEYEGFTNVQAEYAANMVGY